ncbi:MAG TPA: PQQ-binding-like beta-propeller repeat protein, partial [Solirubrobacteraceae bacterium]
DRPWSFRTGKGIFSTPVVGGDGTVYVGSADRTFYALGPRGRVRWRRRTGGIIDAAAALSRGTVTFGSGDERLYHVRTRDHRVLWTFRPTLPPAGGQTVRWWEGNVAVGPNGDLYAGNTGGAAYRIDRRGRQVWARPAGNSVWTTPAFGAGGTTFWGSLDLSIFALGATGATRWTASTLGFVVSSPALGRDGTVYVASFDDKLYALDAATGQVRWTFQTRDHVYASPALATDARGRTTAIYIASTDGSVYAVSPSGKQLWRYDTGDVIRSSPVLGRAPRGNGRILYVGGGDGRLYALDAATGRRRWSFDTTPHDLALHDRNDLNASPALGRTGVYIGGEHGFVWYVPYDYCLHRRDPRCSRAPGQPFGPSVDRVFGVTAGGATAPRLPTVAPATVLDGRLLVRRLGATVDAGMLAPRGAAALVTSTPRFPFHARLSGDGRVVYVVPDGILRPGTRYRVRVAGRYGVNAVGATGAKTPGPPAGRFATTLTLGTAQPASRHLPLRVGRERAGALVLRRLSVPEPSFLTSVNQIGFDDYELIAGALSVRPGRVLMYVIAGRRTRDGRLVPDRHGGFDFPIAGRTRGDALLLARRNLVTRYEFGLTPQRYFSLRGELLPSGQMRPGAGLYTEVDCARDVQYG